MEISAEEKKRREQIITEEKDLVHKKPKMEKPITKEPPKINVELVRSRLEAIQSDEMSREIEFEPVHVGVIAPQDATELLKILNTEWPLSKDLAHLKRIRKLPSSTKADMRLQILLCKKTEVASFNSCVTLPSKIIQETVEVNVPRYPPCTKEQLAPWSAHWPLVFHRQEYISPPVNTLEDAELMKMAEYMHLALAQARLANQKGQLPIGAVIVNFATGQVLAACCEMSLPCASEPVHNPLQHAVLRCIDQVSRDELRRLEMAKASGSTTTPPYMCTGYDLFVTQEPCAMCSMAIVHSRFRRVCYGTANTEFGGLGSLWKIHAEPSLNHHFAVYKGLLRDECTKLWE